MVKKGKIVVKPVLEEQTNKEVDIERTIEAETKMSYEEANKKMPKRCQAISKRVGAKRTIRMSHNVGSFFTYLYAGMFGGKVIPTDYSRNSGFHADVVDESEGKVIKTEVKSTARRNGAPKLSCFQFANALGDFYRLAREVDLCEVNYAIFRYGPTTKSLELSKESNDGLMRVSSKNISDLLVVSLNVLIPMVLAHEFREYDHGTSSGQRTELYSEPQGGLITRIHESPEAMEDLFEDAGEAGIGERDLCFEGVEREELMSPDNLYCGRYKIKPFMITRYYNDDSREWADVFAGSNGKKDGSCYKIFQELNISPMFLQDESEESEDVPF